MKGNSRKPLFNPAVHNRRSLRIPEYDYFLSGLYFVAICVNRRKCLLGKIAKKIPQIIEKKYSGVEIDHFVIMPNHIHAMIQIHDSDRRGGVTTPLFGQIVAFLKYETTKQINQKFGQPGKRFWQRNYFNRTIRDDEELRKISEYIQPNPIIWMEDPDHPSKINLKYQSGGNQ
jgi:putative transposase